MLPDDFDNLAATMDNAARAAAKAQQRLRLSYCGLACGSLLKQVRPDRERALTMRGGRLVRRGQSPTPCCWVGVDECGRKLRYRVGEGVFGFVGDAVSLGQRGG